MITIKLLDEGYKGIVDTTQQEKLQKKISRLERSGKLTFMQFIPMPHLDYTLMDCECREEDLAKYLELLGIKKWEKWEKPENEKEEFEVFLNKHF